jgi:small-conductance mechanosensitive channel
MQSKTEIHNLLIDFFSDLEQVALLWQLAVLAVSLAAAWLLSRTAKKHLHPSGVWHVGVASFNRVAFPLLTLFFVVVAKSLLQHTISVKLLNIAVPLLLSLAMIRLTVYLLRHIFAPSGWVKSFERFIAMLIWAGLALHITGFLPEIIGAMDDLSLSMGKQRISVLLVLEGLVALAATLLIALWLGRTVEVRIMKNEGMDLSLRMVMTKIVRAFLLFIALLVALPAAGIDITVLSVFGGALGVGLGFGLQKIASNYVSGFIILLERSIRIGDMVTVDGRYGEIKQMSTRYTLLRSLDGTEALIPNETLITSTVLNHSFSNREVRIGVPVQVSYNSPLETAMRIMVETAMRHPRVLKDPVPEVFLREFSDNGLNLELSIWIGDPEEGQFGLRSALNLEIWKRFREEGIEIPYPQRDIRIVEHIAQ